MQENPPTPPEPADVPDPGDPSSPRMKPAPLPPSPPLPPRDSTGVSPPKPPPPPVEPLGVPPWLPSAPANACGVTLFVPAAPLPAMMVLFLTVTPIELRSSTPTEFREASSGPMPSRARIVNPSIVSLLALLTVTAVGPPWMVVTLVLMSRNHVVLLKPPYKLTLLATSTLVRYMPAAT